jgi:hypothetical protein
MVGGHWYQAPFAVCRNEYFSHANGDGFPLPFDNLPQTNQDELFSPQGKTPLVLPPGGWSAMIGCFECGLVETYGADDVEDEVVERQSEGIFHNDCVCFCVQAQCGDPRCQGKTEWYVDISGATESDLRRRLQENHFFGKLLCGHDIRTTVNKTSFRLHRVMN